jgi:hypothetical protein
LVAKNKHAVKRARTGDYQPLAGSKLDFETKVLKLLQVEADGRAAHEEKMETLTLKCLEEVQATRRIIELSIADRGVLEVLQVEANRRAVHEEKTEALALKCLEEVQATRQTVELSMADYSP